MADWCPGAGQSVELRQEPSSLVTCPVCGRRNLGAVDVRWDSENYWIHVGTVPKHRAAAPTLADAERAIAATKRHLPGEWQTWSDAAKILDRGYD